MAQPATDLLTYQEAQYAIGVGTLTATQSTLLASAVSGVSEKLSELCGPIVYSTITAELHSGGGSLIYLNQRPVAQILQVIEYDGLAASTLTAQTNFSETSNDYVANLNNGRILRRDTNTTAFFPVGESNVAVDYIAGRAPATSGTVTPLMPQRFKDAASLMLKNYWRMYENSVAQIGEYDVPIAEFPKFAVPVAVEELLAQDWQVGSGGFDT